MWKLHSLLCLFCFILLFSSATEVSADGDQTWLTLNGDQPVVIGRCGFSGVFPECSGYAYSLAENRSLPNSIVSCDVHLTKDRIGICFPSINLMNASTINCESTQQCSPADFTFDELRNELLTRAIYSRAPYFDATQPIQTVAEVLESLSPPSQRKLAGVWLSVPYDAVYRQHNLSMKDFVASVSQNSTSIQYISSPEVAFLRGIESGVLGDKTKRVFQFLGRDIVEPTTKKTYGSILENLTAIKEFADGILVAKDYIQQVDQDQYLMGITSVVQEGHAAGLQVFASGFANDVPDLPYDYSYDPLLEYLTFIDNGTFCVDGVLSDFPITPSGAIECFAGMGKKDIADTETKLLVISNEGASGDFPGCTDAAYEKAVSDGADVIDCPVQMTSDRVAFCMGSYNLSSRIQFNNSDSGVFASDLTWKQIQALTPSMYNPYEHFILHRNPKGNGVGKFMKLADFLEFASNQSSLSGVLISIEDGDYRASGLNITDAVSSTLSGSTYKKKVMISSSESSVLKYFKNDRFKGYELVYMYEDKDVNTDPSLIKDFANSVVIPKNFVLPTNKHLFLTNVTGIVSSMHGSSLSVYVKTFQNEFVSSAWDFFSDPTVEINTYVVSQGIDGVITDFPATANRYRRNNRCLAFKNTSVYLTPVVPGDLSQFIYPN